VDVLGIARHIQTTNKQTKQTKQGAQKAFLTPGHHQKGARKAEANKRVSKTKENKQTDVFVGV
jgi:hypothetical protein